MGCQLCRTGTVQADHEVIWTSGGQERYSHGLSVMQNRGSSGKDTIDMSCQLCRTGTVQAIHDMTWTPEGQERYSCQLCRTGAVQVEVTWGPGKVQWTWDVSRAGQGQFRLK